MIGLHSTSIRGALVALDLVAACVVGYLLGSWRRAPNNASQLRSAGTDPAEAGTSM
jgi:hypothetical protein